MYHAAMPQIKIKPQQSKFQTDETRNMFGKGLLDRDMRLLTKRFSRPKSEREFRDRALFLVLSQTGLRAAEIVQLRLSQMMRSPTGERIWPYRRKGGRAAFCAPGEEAIRAVQAYHKHMRIENPDAFFLSLPNRARNRERSVLTTRSLQRIVNAWNVRTASGRLVHPHALRHSVGQRIFDVAGSIAAQKILGHSSPLTTGKFYTRPYFPGAKYLKW